MFPAAERSVFFSPPTEGASVCVCVYFIRPPAAGEITATLYSVTAIRQGEKKLNADKAGTQRHISADEIIPPSLKAQLWVKRFASTPLWAWLGEQQT